MVIYNMFSMKFDDLTDLSCLSSNILKSFQGLQQNHTHIPMAFMDLDGIKLCVSVPLPNNKSLPNFVNIPFFFAYFMLLLKGSLNSVQLHLRTGQTSMDVAQLNRHIFQGNVLSLEPKLGSSTPRATTTFPVH